MQKQTDPFFDLTFDLQLVLKENCISEINSACFMILGYSASEMINKSLFDFIHPDDLDLMAHGLEAGKELVIRCRHKQGHYRQLCWRTQFDTQSKLLYGVAHDVTGHDLKSLSAVQTVMDACADGLTVHDSKGRLVSCNAAWLQMNTNGGAFCREDLSHLSEDEHPTTRATRTGQPQQWQVLGCSIESAEQRWYDVAAMPVTEGGEVVQVVTVFHDVTRRRGNRQQLESVKARLEEREAFLETMLNDLPCLVAYLDVDLKYRFLNKAYDAWMDVDRQQWIGKHPRDILGDEVFEKARPAFEMALKGKSQHFELSYFIGSQLRLTDVRYLPDFKDGVVRGIYAFVVDISAQVLARQAIEQKEEELTRVFDALPSLVVSYDHNLRGIRRNNAHFEFYGGPKDIRGMPIEDIIGHFAAEKKLSLLKTVLKGESHSFETEVQSRLGLVKYLYVNMIPDTHGGALVVATDLTLLKKLEMQKREIETQMIAASRLSSLGEMAAGIAHEINNPLAIITAQTHLLQYQNDAGSLEPQKLKTSLTKISDTVQRIAKIVRGLQAFARNAEKDPMQNFDLQRIISECLAIGGARIKNAGVEIRLNVTDTPMTVMGRPPQIAQIFMNFLNNAFDAVAELPEKWIEIRLSADGAIAKLEVVDSGAGISAEVETKMMQPFFTTKPVGKGTGLGLSISKGMAEDNGGSVRYELKDQHTCFILEMPVAQSRRDAA